MNTFVGFGVGLLDLFDWIEAGDAYPLLVVDVLDIFKISNMVEDKVYNSRPTECRPVFIGLEAGPTTASGSIRYSISYGYSTRTERERIFFFCASLR